MTTVFNGAGEGSAKASWVLMRRTRADTFRSANRRKNLHRFSMLHVSEPKNLTCIGPHPRTQKNQRFQSWTPAMSGGLTTPPDTTPPSVPTNLSASAISSSAINLTWTSSTDNVGVAGYDIYRNGTQVGTS